jgi:hypothetical protein
MNKATFYVAVGIISLLPCASFSQELRTIEGLILSFDEKTPMPGFVIYELGKPASDVLCNVEGKFALDVQANRPAFVVLHGIHYDKFVKYEENQSFKTFLVYEGSMKKLEKQNKRIKREWARVNRTNSTSTGS